MSRSRKIWMHVCIYGVISLAALGIYVQGVRRSELRLQSALQSRLTRDRATHARRREWFEASLRLSADAGRGDLKDFDKVRQTLLGLDTRSTEPEVEMAMRAAARAGKVEVISYCMNCGYVVKSDRKFFTDMLLDAAFFVQPAVIRFVLGAGADPNGTPGSEIPPLVALADQHALQVRAVECARILIAAGADTDCVTRSGPNGSADIPDGSTPLIVAAGKGNDPLVTLLLRSHADPAIRNAAGLTAADAAQRSRHLTLARRLLTIQMAVLKKSSAAALNRMPAVRMQAARLDTRQSVREE